MIEAKELSRNYGDFTAVDSVSFSISPGEIVGLLGHNGAGKTTIMKMLTGYLEPTAGSATIDGLDIIEKRLEIQEKIGYLPENCPLYPDMTVINYLEYVASMRSIPEASSKEVLFEILNKARLVEKATSSINTLSRGYQQRVGVAQAIIHKPPILILDEPTNGLDPSQIQEMRSLIKELSKNSTVIISTHILQEVEAVCDRVIIILQGKKALDSKLEDLQTANNLMLSTDTSPDKATEELKKLAGIANVEFLSSEDNKHHYKLSLENEDHDLVPNLTKELINRGYNLFSFHPEKRNLESVFREINAG